MDVYVVRTGVGGVVAADFAVGAITAAEQGVKVDVQVLEMRIL